MVAIAAYTMIALGALHVLFGVIRFRKPLGDACREGFIGRFEQSDARRLAFWFIAIGPLMSLLGWASLDVYKAGDLPLIATMGVTLLVVGVIGVLAFPRSPLWSLFPPSLMFIAGGFSPVAPAAQPF